MYTLLSFSVVEGCEDARGAKEETVDGSSWWRGGYSTQWDEPPSHFAH